MPPAIKLLFHFPIERPIVCFYARLKALSSRISFQMSTVPKRGTGVGGCAKNEKSSSLPNLKNKKKKKKKGSISFNPLFPILQRCHPDRVVEKVRMSRVCSYRKSYRTGSPGSVRIRFLIPQRQMHIVCGLNLTILSLAWTTSPVWRTQHLCRAASGI